MAYIEDRDKLKFAKQLRKSSTRQEGRLWKEFLSKHEYKFRRQHIVGPFILDFYCHKLKLAIELDGDQHYNDKNEEYDKQRTAYLEKQGITVLRIDNFVVDDKFEFACEMIDGMIRDKLL